MSASNGIIHLRCDRVVDVSPSGSYRGGAELAVEVRMNKQQMRAAVEQFLEHVTDAEWAAWVEDLSPGVIAALAAREAA